MSENRYPFLNEVHQSLGAKIVPFGGWAMPLQYEKGTLHEHQTCRTDAVVFDVSHLGTVRVTGPNSLATLQNVLTNDLRRVAPGRAQYTHLLNEKGGVEDDIIVWWMGDDEFDVMPNASNTSGVLSAIGGVDVTADRCVLAIQGPEARKKIALLDSRFATVQRFHVEKMDFEGCEVRVAGTGYTGEDGVEIAIPNECAADMLLRLVAAGIEPAGLGARDNLRLEAALPLHGHELSPSISTLEAGLGWVVGWNKESFRGRVALERQMNEGVPRHLVGLVADTRQPLRDHAEIIYDGTVVGELTSGNYSPVLERGIGLGFSTTILEPGDRVSISLRGRELPASIVKTPFIRKVK